MTVGMALFWALVLVGIVVRDDPGSNSQRRPPEKIVARRIA